MTTCCGRSQGWAANSSRDFPFLPRHPSPHPAPSSCPEPACPQRRGGPEEEWGGQGKQDSWAPASFSLLPAMGPPPGEDPDQGCVARTQGRPPSPGGPAQSSRVLGRSFTLPLLPVAAGAGVWSLTCLQKQAHGEGPCGAPGCEGRRLPSHSLLLPPKSSRAGAPCSQTKVRYSLFHHGTCV